jgi:hypothetical protein
VNGLTLRRRRSPRRAPWLAAAVVTVAAGAVVIVRRSHGASEDGRRSWSCNCGQAYLVSGIDRHRVYWLPDAGQFEPLLVRECVSCGSELPAGHDAALV